MNQLKIYIDFEAISSPFNREIKIKRDFPYAYSLGVFSGNKFKSKTFIFNFNKESIDDINDILRLNILKDVRELTGNKKTVINKESSVFVSYAPTLERKILSNVYKGVKVKDISKGAMISISQATEEYIEKNSYFSYLKDYVKNNISEHFFNKRGLYNDGALASIAGYYLYMNAHNKKGRFIKKDIDNKILVKELANYSNDDVVRMKYLEQNKQKFFEKAKIRKSNILKRNKISSEIRRIDHSINNLKGIDQDMTIETYIKIMSKKRKKLDKEIDELDI